jgi:Flp pilus assembly protein TadG
MMRKLDKRGVAALEFCLVAVTLFTLMFVIFDLGRYAITMQSLRMLANAEARAMMINNCYVNAEINKTTPACTGDYLSLPQKQAVATFLYGAGLTPTVTIPTPGVGATALTVTASQPGFTMLVPIWGTALNAPSASTSIPF